MKKYRKKPVEVEAIQWTGENIDDVFSFVGGTIDEWSENDLTITIGTLEGNHLATLGDYIIKGIADEFYPCKPDIFRATYEEVE